MHVNDPRDYTGFDALAFHNGQQFSTWDRDQDASPSHNCASTHMGAWWFYKCQHSNLNGVYGRGDQKGVVWWKHTGSDIMKETTMMLRCNNTAIWEDRLCTKYIAHLAHVSVLLILKVLRIWHLKRLTRWEDILCTEHIAHLTRRRSVC